MHPHNVHTDVNADTIDRLLTFSDARKIVGISRSKIYLLLQEDAFPAPVKIGKSNFFSQREIQAWVLTQLQRRSRTVAGNRS